MPSKCDRIKVEEGEILHFDTWGGGGWGDPLKRSFEQVEFDVRAGLVSTEGARRYGVVIDENHTVDQQGSNLLREEMALARGDPKLFDFGGTIEELKARCKQETGLEPPSQPQFQQWVTRA